jgi:hypothetical protein
MTTLRTAVAIGVVAILVAIAVIWNRAREPANGMDAVVAQMVPKIEAATGLRFRVPPRVDTRSREEVRGFLVAQLDDSTTAHDLAGQELVLKRFGLIPEGVALRQLLLDVLEEQVAGFYDPKSSVLYVVEGSPAEMRDITITHELIHALQDQHISLDSIQKMRGMDDRQLSAQAVMEGQATLEQMQIMVGGDMSAVVPGGWEGVRQIIRQEQAKMPRFSAAPAVIQEMLLFPYLSGAEYVRRFKEARPGLSILENMPESTEQILNRSAAFDSVDHPTEIQLPALLAGTAVHENTMGEFSTRLFLFEHLDNADDARLGASGWDGDRYLLFRPTAGGTGIVWVSVWDSAVEAAEFREKLVRHFDLRFGSVDPVQVAAAQRPGTIDGVEYRTSGRNFFVGAAEIASRPAVIFVDVPAGSPWSVIDFRRISLR